MLDNVFKLVPSEVHMEFSPTCMVILYLGLTYGTLYMYMHKLYHCHQECAYMYECVPIISLVAVTTTR